MEATNPRSVAHLCDAAPPPAAPPGSVAHLCDAELIAALKRTIAAERVALADVLVHLGEVDARRLYAEWAYPSCFAYCTGELGYSEAAARKRILVARLTRRVPGVLERVRAGQVHLSGLCVVSAELHRNAGDAVGCAALLDAISGKTVDAIREWLADRAPKPDAPTRLRKLPERHRAKSRDEALRPTATTGAAPVPEPAATSAPNEAAPRKAATVEPLGQARYRLQITVPKRVRDKLQHARDLLAHRAPGADLDEVLERAVDELIARLEAERFAKRRGGERASGAGVAGKERTAKQRASKRVGAGDAAEPRAGGDEATEQRTAKRAACGDGADGNAMRQRASKRGGELTKQPSRADDGARREPGERRAIPAAVKREVYELDAGSCSYVDERGRRCGSRRQLEYAHVRAHALGGEVTAENLRLRCRAHNQREAIRELGTERGTECLWVRDACCHTVLPALLTARRDGARSASRSVRRTQWRGGGRSASRSVRRTQWRDGGRSARRRRDGARSASRSVRRAQWRDVVRSAGHRATWCGLRGEA